MVGRVNLWDLGMTEVTDVLDRYPELKTEARIVSLLNLLAISKQGLREILERHRVGSPLKIKERISRAAIAGHPGSVRDRFHKSRPAGQMFPSVGSSYKRKLKLARRHGT